jgi:hypothetical protein
MVRSVQTVCQSCVRIRTVSNELSEASTWASSPRSIFICVRNDFWAYGMFSTNRAPILHWHQHYLQMDQNKIWHDPRHLGVPSGVSKSISNYVVHSAQTVHLLVSRLALSSNGPNQAFTWDSSPRSTIGCVQNDFWAYGTFSANRAPILLQD